jgi:hypothetical protein
MKGGGFPATPFLGEWAGGTLSAIRVRQKILNRVWLKFCEQGPVVPDHFFDRGRSSDLEREKNLQKFFESRS